MPCRSLLSGRSLIAVVGRRAPLEGLTEEERLMVQYVREYVNSRCVSDETFAAAHSALGDLPETEGFEPAPQLDLTP